jgi:RNA polymerase sigma factor (TIGR02999 family)
MNEFTQLLNRLNDERELSADELLPLVYEELRRLAARKMARETPGHTLQATALVHEAWMKVGRERHTWENRIHFFSAAAEAMRRILIDRARERRAARHGGRHERVNIEEIEIVAPAPEDELLMIHETIDRFAAVDPPKAELVKLRYFAGLTIEEAADLRGISVPTAKRHWAYARAWLFREVRKSGFGPP